MLCFGNNILLCWKLLSHFRNLLTTMWGTLSSMYVCLNVCMYVCMYVFIYFFIRIKNSETKFNQNVFFFPQELKTCWQHFLIARQRELNPPVGHKSPSKVVFLWYLCKTSCYHFILQDFLQKHVFDIMLFKILTNLYYILRNSVFCITAPSFH